MSVLSHWVTSTGSGVYPYSSCFWQMCSKSIFNCMKNNHDRCLNIRIIARIILYVSLHLWSTDLCRQRNSLGPSRDGNNFAVSFITSYSPSFTALSPSLPHSMSHTLPHILIATLLSLISSLPHFPHTYPHSHPHHHKLHLIHSLIATLTIVPIIVFILTHQKQVVHCTGYIKNWPPQGIQMERSVEDELHASRFILFPIYTSSRWELFILPRYILWVVEKCSFSPNIVSCRWELRFFSFCNRSFLKISFFSSCCLVAIGRLQVLFHCKSTNCVKITPNLIIIIDTVAIITGDNRTMNTKTTMMTMSCT